MVHRFIILTKEVTIKNKNHSPKADECAIKHIRGRFSCVDKKRKI